MKSLVTGALIIASAATLLFLRFSGRIQPREMGVGGRLLLWWSAFLLSFGPLTISFFKLLRETWRYDASPLSIALYAGAALVAAFIASKIAHWVAESDNPTS